MRAYEQIANMTNISVDEAKNAFEKWCEDVGYNEEEGDKKLFEIGINLAIPILRIYI